jgi:hypothetical protein
MNGGIDDQGGKELVGPLDSGEGVMIERLLHVIDTLAVTQGDPGDPTELEAAVRAAPPVGILPPPQVSWTLLALLHYRRRKRWAWRVVRQRLPWLLRRENRPASDRDDRDLSRQRIVPGLPDWEYGRVVSSSFLTHRGSGERLHIHLSYGPENLRVWEFREYLRYHRRPGPAGRRLAELFPGARGIRVAFDELTRYGAMQHLGEEQYTLSRRAAASGRAARGLLASWTRPCQRVRLAAPPC